MKEYEIKTGQIQKTREYYIQILPRENGKIVEDECRMQAYKTKLERDFAYIVLLSGSRKVIVEDYVPIEQEGFDLACEIFLDELILPYLEKAGACR